MKKKQSNQHFAIGGTHSLSKKRDKANNLRINSAAGDGNIAEVMRCLRDGVLLDARDPHIGKTPLISASLSGERKTVEFLLQKGAMLNALVEHEYPNDFVGLNALMAASRCGHTEVVRTLLQAGAEINLNAGNTRLPSALSLAALGGHTETVKLLLENNAVVAYSELHSAVSGVQDEVVKILLEADVDVNDVPSGVQPLLAKCCSLKIDGSNRRIKQVSVLRQLLDAEVEINALDADGNTALMVAVLRKNDSCTAMLIACGADVTLQNHNGATALHFAASNGSVATIDVLLRAGAHARVEDYMGKLPVDWAVKWQHPECVGALTASSRHAVRWTKSKNK